ncbi:constitutive coactivator of peroxisome proliferator-activated receptor gamma isoform X1 [Electrophorus electricus]|uniref:constitutive coactivator of peroxisome proliferator-activated receptor gamma isoform X1 n=1 Tax=Electrophorus electricus TaxID=8005 RepID=UPI0015CFE2BE|nr:constitutive coactivator of peroxisome proliferator-activated receptor gamma isoform X1 [Electrophorus electricus]XP_026858342.2 constitutive coactivator of peroxisome proliferator-activated receptor gamma isoform X1 [Electrophorus electricus]XP_026858344.2 constitutive coactivator of peroxisome proliferator-activated receptor gamma isoform X1 [Electrophorus electricus]
MGVKGLQYFMETCSPEICLPVDLRQMAVAYTRGHHDIIPTVVVDGMACLRYWYQCQAWVHGGQWREYMHLLEKFVGAFTAAGLRLVFFFDGTVEEQKRAEWVKRRLRVNKDIVRIFHYIKDHCQQPDGEMLCLPSGLATFTRFALKSLGQETWCSIREGDFEIAEYALCNKCMGILGQDTDFVIYDTVPYLSISKLRLENMTTVQFSREKLCDILKLQKSDLPLLACILGNDIVPEHRLHFLRKNALTSYGKKNKGDKILSVADFISSVRPNNDGMHGISLMPLSKVDKELVEKGILSYLLPGQTSPWLESILPSQERMCVMEKYINKDILQAAKEKHVRAECFMIYNVLHDGVVECSNTLEDEEEPELLPQAILYQLIREHIYCILLPELPASCGHTLSVKEWFVFPGNPLNEPNKVTPKAPNLPGGTPDLMGLWFGNESEVKSVRLSTFLAVFDLQDLSQDLDHFDSSFVAVICLTTYIAIQAKHLSLEDIDAYLSQAVCIRYKSYTELKQTSVPEVDSRAVQLGSLFVRGLTYVSAANSACGFPFPMLELMPWKTFDGLLFHSKYLQAHSGCPKEELLDGNPAWLSLFLSLRELVLGSCRRHGFTVPSQPRRLQHEGPIHGEHHRESGSQIFSTSELYYSDQPRGTAYHIHGQGQRQRPRSRHPNRRRYHLAPRWPPFENQRPAFH